MASRLIPIPAVPCAKKTQKQLFCPFQRRFRSFGWGIAGIQMRRDVTPPSSSPDAELWKKVGFFENPPTGWDTGAGGLKFREQNLAPWKFSAPLLDSNFNVDYDVVIKHGPIQSNDRVMNICAMSKSRWAPKITIIPWSRLVRRGGATYQM